jgi:hypothetical protein
MVHYVDLSFNFVLGIGIQDFIYEKNKGIALIILTRPERLNVLPDELISE